MNILSKNTFPALVALLSFAILYMQPIRVAFYSLVAALIVFGLSGSMEMTLGVLGISIALGGFNRFFESSEPVGIEAFQSNDPLTTVTRLEEIRQTAPLMPKAEPVTGVLESPTILDNVPMNPYQESSSDAQPGASIPASAKSRVLIYPVPENSVKKEGFQDAAPMANPVLQNGPDSESVETAMISDGTEMPAAANGADAMGGVESGPAPAF